MKEFFRKIHLTVTDAKYLAAQALSAATKSVFGFFILLFFVSMTISTGVRTERIIKRIPYILVSAAGELKFENYNLVSPDTLKTVETWKLKELGTLISGIKAVQPVAYPTNITIGTDSISASEKPFIHIGTTAFSTNVLSSILGKNPDAVQSIAWNAILPSPNIIADVDFYKTQFSKISAKINVFFGAGTIIAIEMISAILQIWIAILIYLLFFGKKLNIFGRLRMIMLTAIPYFIVMPISLIAANGIAWTTDIALIGGLIMSFRAVAQIDLNSAKESGNDNM